MYFYLEFKLCCLENLKLFSIRERERVKELFDLFIVLRFLKHFFGDPDL